MKSLVKELKRKGFRKGYPVPAGFEEDLERIRKELGNTLLVWEVVKSEMRFFRRFREIMLSGIWDIRERVGITFL